MIEEDKKTEVTTTTKKTELIKQAQVQQTTQSHTQPHITPTQPVLVAQNVIQPPPGPISQPTNPNNKTSQLLEINLKEELKEGSDMVAFNENNIEQNSIANILKDYFNNDNGTILDNNEDANINNDITTIDQSIKAIIEHKAESKFDVMDIVLANEKLVQAKNEVSAKVNANIIDTNLHEIKLKLQYGDGQWSPVNQNGQKVYGAELLLALRDDPKSKLKPENINIHPDLMVNDRSAMNAVSTPRKDYRLTSSGQIDISDRKPRRNVSTKVTHQSRNRGSAPITVNSDKLETQTPLTDEPFGSRQIFADWSGGAKSKPIISNMKKMYSVLNDNVSDVENRKTANDMRSHNKDSYNSKGPSLEGNYRSYEDGRGSRSGSQHRLQDSSVSNRSAPKDQPPTVPAVTEITPEEFDIQLKKILENYLTYSDINLCDNNIRRLFPLSDLPKIVTEGYYSVLEKSKTARSGTGQLFAKLIVLGTLSVEDYCIGLTSILSLASYLIIDIPKLWDYLGELIAPVLCERAFTMRDLHKCSENLIDSNHASKLLISIFNLIIQEKGPAFLNSIWNSSGITLDKFMPLTEVDDFINHNKFECLHYSDFTANYQSNSVLTPQELQYNLVMFIKRSAPFKDIVHWITTHVGQDDVKQPAFIKSLTNAVYGECIVDSKSLKPDLLKNKVKLLQRYLDSQSSLELQCLFAIQALCCKLEYPSGLLLAIFDELYEESLISLESFFAWELSTDPAEQEGKSVALKQLTSFFIHLREGEDDNYSFGSEEENFLLYL